MLRHGPEYATVLLDGLSAWMRRRGYTTLGDLRGPLAVPADSDQAAYERAGYVRALRAANHTHGPWRTVEPDLHRRPHSVEDLRPCRESRSPITL